LGPSLEGVPFIQLRKCKRGYKLCVLIL
jgi:hypothetical protein